MIDPAHQQNCLEIKPAFCDAKHNGLATLPIPDWIGTRLAEMLGTC